MATRLHLLAGTEDAVHVARAVARDTRIAATASIARPGILPQQFGVPLRIGGWGGREGLRDWLRRERVQGVIDATDPFAETISHVAHEVCAELGIPRVQFLRSPWIPGPEHSWTFLNSAVEIGAHASEGATVWFATEARGLGGLGTFEGRRVFVRTAGHPESRFPFAEGEYVVRTRGLNIAGAEAELMARRVDWIVVRNSGQGTIPPEVEAARRLGIAVAMIRRPPQPEGPRIQTVSEALVWIRGRL
ncbi:MAG: precorrin-6A/cobalt-precorrin-6A reductase [Pseudomonadota bacterium]